MNLPWTDECMVTLSWILAFPSLMEGLWVISHILSWLNVLSCETPLGFEPTPLRFSWVSLPALNPPRHKNTQAARQTESDPVLTTLLPPLFLSGPWSALDPHKADSQLAISRLPSQLTPATRRCLIATRAVPPWLSLDYPTTQKFQAGIVQYNQFTVNTGMLWHHLSWETPLGFEPTPTHTTGGVADSLNWHLPEYNKLICVNEHWFSNDLW